MYKVFMDILFAHKKLSFKLRYVIAVEVKKFHKRYRRGNGRN